MNYEQFAVTGLKIRYIPTNVSGLSFPEPQGPQGVIESMSFYQDIDDFAGLETMSNV